MKITNEDIMKTIQSNKILKKFDWRTYQRPYNTIADYYGMMNGIELRIFRTFGTESFNMVLILKESSDGGHDNNLIFRFYYRSIEKCVQAMMEKVNQHFEEEDKLKTIWNTL